MEVVFLCFCVVNTIPTHSGNGFSFENVVSFCFWSFKLNDKHSLLYNIYIYSYAHCSLQIAQYACILIQFNWLNLVCVFVCVTKVIMLPLMHHLKPFCFHWNICDGCACINFISNCIWCGVFLWLVQNRSWFLIASW